MEYVTLVLSFLATALLTVLGILWRSQEKKVDKIAEEKQGKELCDERHKNIDEKFGVLFAKFDGLGDKIDKNKEASDEKMDELIKIMMDVQKGINGDG